MSFNLFDTDVPNNYTVPSHITASLFRFDAHMRQEFQNYQNEYSNTLNSTIVQMFTKIINAYTQFMVITRQINQNATNLNQTLNVYNSLDEQAKQEMDRSRNITKILNISKLKVWLILFSTEQLKEQFDFLQDIVLLYHVTLQAYSDSNNTNEVLRDLLPKIETLINDFNSYIEQCHQFRVGINQRISSTNNNLGQTVRTIERSYVSEYEELKNTFAQLHDDLDDYVSDLNEQMQLLHQPIANPEVMTGPAWEVHNYFASLNMQRIEEIMTQYNVTHQQNPNTIDPQSNIDFLFKPLLIFVQRSDLFPETEKNNYTSRLTFINNYIIENDEYNDLDRLRNIIDIALEFVIKHDDNYISEYIRSYIDACLNAYATNGLSCVPGMIERIVTENGIIIKALCLEGCDEVNEELNGLFNKTLNDVIQEWSNTFLEGGPEANLLENMTLEQRKQHLIQFIRNSYNNIIDANLALKIAEEVNKYEEMGVFQNLHFGGKKKKQTNKKKTKKTNKIKKKSNKRRINKRKTNKKKN